MLREINSIDSSFFMKAKIRKLINTYYIIQTKVSCTHTDRELHFSRNRYLRIFRECLQWILYTMGQINKGSQLVLECLFYIYKTIRATKNQFPPPRQKSAVLRKEIFLLLKCFEKVSNMILYYTKFVSKRAFYEWMNEWMNERMFSNGICADAIIP